ncbi:MAG: hypothetical protein WCA46_23815, partial [Actinocatenispora sp.]
SPRASAVARPTPPSASPQVAYATPRHTELAALPPGLSVAQRRWMIGSLALFLVAALLALRVRRLRR